MGLIVFILSLTSISILVYMSKSKFQELQIPSNVSRALLDIYQYMGKTQGQGEQKYMQTFKNCFESDFYYLNHPDTIIQFPLCFRVKNDGIKGFYKKNCYNYELNQEEPASFQSVLILNYQSKKMDFDEVQQKLCLFQQAQYFNFGRMHSKLHTHKIISQKLDQNRQECEDSYSIIPKSYDIDNAGECKEGLQKLRKRFKFNQTTQEYILKSDDHGTNGITYIDKTSYRQLMKLFQNGSSCGQSSEPSKTLIQEVVTPLITENNLKMDFRIWALFLFTDQPVIYIYDQFLVMQCLEPFIQGNNNLGSIVCSEETEVQESSPSKVWKMSDLQDFVVAQKITKDSDWVKKKFLKQVKDKLYNFVNLTFQNSKLDFRQSALTQIDFTIDKNQNVLLLDFNSGPIFNAISPANRKLQRELQKNTPLKEICEDQKVYLKSICSFAQGNLNNQFQQPTNSQQLSPCFIID